MSKKISINVVIADRPYPMLIDPEEEEMVRKAAKQINEDIRNFKNKYEAKDKQDFLAMCSLIYAVKNAQSEKNIQLKDQSVMDEINEILKKIENTDRL
ncbi:MAG: cell division protein ZapA [Chitinophagaceae bacterium]|nr:MAG: cell division protein ZapA [Chitinophagaceae bacterium]